MQCQKCSSEMKLVPAGISKKTNKPYNAFFACQNRECGNTQQVQAQGAPAKAMNNLQTKTNDQKDSEKAMGMIRHGLVLKAIDKGMELNPTTHNWVSKWANYIMTGQLLATVTSDRANRFSEFPEQTQEEDNEIQVDSIPF